MANARKATPEELEASKKLEEALEQENNQTPDNGPASLALNEGGDTPEAKRKPGRPKGSGAGGKATEELLTNAVGGGDASQGTGRKPGRPSGKSKATDPAALGKQLVGVHQLAAMFTSTPELQLSPEEAQGLADAVVAVCNEYGLSVDGKTGASIQLFAACAMIYAPRVMAIRFRLAQERANNASIRTADAAN